MKKSPKISNGARKIFLISFLFLFLAPVVTQASGLVPCGGESEPSCNICHLFEMINNIVREVMFKFVPAIAILMLTVGGALFFVAGAKPDVLNQAKGIIVSAIIGLVIIFCAWIIVNTVLTRSGIIESTSPLWKWYEIRCTIP